MPVTNSLFGILWRLHRAWSLDIPQDFRSPVPLDVALAVALCSSQSLPNILGSSAFAALGAVLRDSPTAWCCIAPHHAARARCGGATEHRLQQRDTSALRRRSRWTLDRTLDNTYKEEHSACIRYGCPRTTRAKSMSSPGSHQVFFAKVLSDDSPHRHPHLPPSQAGKGRWSYRGAATENLLH